MAILLVGLRALGPGDMATGHALLVVRPQHLMTIANKTTEIFNIEFRNV